MTTIMLPKELHLKNFTEVVDMAAHCLFRGEQGACRLSCDLHISHFHATLCHVCAEWKDTHCTEALLRSWKGTWTDTACKSQERLAIVAATA